MVETKTQDYWEDLSKKGELENNLSSEVEKLLKKYTEAGPNGIIRFNTKPFSFLKEFLAQLTGELDAIFSKYRNLNQKEAAQKKSKIEKQILDHLTTVHIKKIACEIKFDAYSLLKLFRALEKIVSEAQFIITPEGIFIEIMDPSRICMIQIILKESSYKYFGKGKYALNIKNLINVLSCEANDKSITTLQFTDADLLITIKSEKFESKINRTSEFLDLELEPIPLDNLKNIKYPIQFSLEQFRFIYTMKNLGIYSEIVDITADNKNNKKAVIFNESGDAGTGEVIWEKKNLLNLQFFHDLIKEEFEEIEDTSNEKYKDSLEIILKEEQCTSAHSLTFLKWIEEITKVLERKDPISFCIKDDHPMKIEIDFNKLGDTSLLYFLAPRALVNEDEFNDELEDF